MRKRFVYIGLVLLAAAVVAFLVYGYFGGSAITGELSRLWTTVNLTVAGGSFSYAQVPIGNTTGAQIVAVSSGRANMYLFNYTNFASWSARVSGNASASGLAFAQALGQASGSAVKTNVNASEFLLTANVSAVQPSQNISVRSLLGFGSAAYVVVDNTHGSMSYNGQVTARVLYFEPTPKFISLYRQISTTALEVMLPIIIVFVAGVALLVYGMLKGTPVIDIAAGKGQDKEQVSKEYIDGLYKHVRKGKRKE